MNLEIFVSNMMKMNSYGRLWHWATDSAQHHVTYEKFLTENEALTDSFAESVMGNDIPFNVTQLNIKASIEGEYDLSRARSEISNYRSAVREQKEVLESKDQGELSAILDDVIELCSKTLYLLKLK